MKTIANKLVKKHKLKRNKYYKKNPYEQRWGTISEDELKLLESWSTRIERGAFGINIGNPCPTSWFRALHEFFIEVEKKCPDFTIVKVAVKFGGILIRLNDINSKVKEAIEILQDAMFDNNLVY